MNMAKICTKKLTDNGVIFDFEGFDNFEITPDLFNEEIQKQIMLYGIKQVFGDSYASATNITEAYEMCQDKLATFKSGEWSKTRTTSGNTILMLAIAKAYDITKEEAQENYEQLTEVQQKSLAKHPNIKKAKAEIELERLTLSASNAPIADLPNFGKEVSDTEDTDNT
jgi:hypothetical protein